MRGDADYCRCRVAEPLSERRPARVRQAPGAVVPVAWRVRLGWLSSSAAHKSLAKLFRQGFISPQAIAAQLLAVSALIAIVKIDRPTTMQPGRDDGERLTAGEEARHQHDGTG
jgi:hypothetical protein